MSKDVERIYTINLGKALISQSQHRATRAINMIKEFARHHMKVETIKIEEELAQEIWARGARSPPRKVRVLMNKTDDGYILVSRYTDDIDAPDTAEETAADDDTAEETAADDDTAEETAADDDTAEETAADDDTAEETAADDDTAEKTTPVEEEESAKTEEISADNDTTKETTPVEEEESAKTEETTK